MPEAPAILERRVGELIDDVAAPTPAPAGGSVAAVTLMLAASLVEMAARLSTSVWAGAEAAAAKAASLKQRAKPLAQRDAEAYGAVLAAMRARSSGERGGAQAGAGEEAVGRALEAAAAIPLEVVEIAAEVAQLGARVTEHGNPRLRGDAACGAALAEAAARASANLVAINLESPQDERVLRANDVAEVAARAARAALAPAS